MPKRNYKDPEESIKKISGKNNPFYGKKHSPETRAKMKETHRKYQRAKLSASYGEKHHNWKGGKHKNAQGYMLILQRDHPHANKCGYILYSRYVMENHIGRFLKKGETIHHINHIRDDDRIENLKLFSSVGEHLSFHNSYRDYSKHKWQTGSRSKIKECP